MSYRGPQFNRMSRQILDVQGYAGHRVTWKQFVSAEGGNAVLGIGESVYYRESLVSAHMRVNQFGEGQTDVGMIPSESITCVTRFKPSSRDEFVWDGTLYRVESDPQPSRFGGQWRTTLIRGDD